MLCTDRFLDPILPRLLGRARGEGYETSGCVWDPSCGGHGVVLPDQVGAEPGLAAVVLVAELQPPVLAGSSKGVVDSPGRDVVDSVDESEVEWVLYYWGQEVASGLSKTCAWEVGGRDMRATRIPEFDQ